MFTFYDNAQQQQQQEHIYFERSKSKELNQIKHICVCVFNFMFFEVFNY